MPSLSNSPLIRSVPHSLFSRVSQWLKDHQDQLNTLVFGNHRQYADISGGKQASNLYRVLQSFVAWVDRYGQGSPAAAFDVAAKDPETRFAQLFSCLAEGPHHVYWMGRTGAFDLIDLLNDLGLLSARPASPYLVGATGPLRGARRIWGEHLSPRRLDELAAELARRLGVRMQALEDGLCNSQKGRLR
jgi:Alpha-glutamyl/putrescinyl thymine pyrophosphorylase clade 3